MKGKSILIVILLVIILGLVGYICYSKGVFSRYTPTEPLDETERTMSEEDALSLLNKFNINVGTVENYDESTKMDAVVALLENVKCGENTKCENYVTKTCKEIVATESDKWKLESDGYYYSLVEKDFHCDPRDSYHLYSFDNVNSRYKSMYGRDLEKKNIYPYYYVEKLDVFVELLYGDGTSGPSVDIEKVKSASIKDDLLTITVYLDVIGLNEEDEIGKNFYKGSNYFSEEDLQTIRNEIEEKYLDKVNCYNVTFNVENDKYIFSNIKKV